MDNGKSECSILELGKIGTVYEDNTKFGQSIFSKVYERARKLTIESIKTQQESRCNREHHERIENIITFMGRRGTGKTSAMLSFMESLKDNSPNKLGENFYEDVNFVCLDWIDASLLEKGEDVFELILSRMMMEFLKDEENLPYAGRMEYELKELYRNFESIYKKLLHLKRRSDIDQYSDQNAISTLRDLARSNDLRVEFEKLIRVYVNLKQRIYPEKYCSDKTFLVVAIDDIDMNVEYCFESLENIRRYLKVNGILVLLSINYDQMEAICEKHFSKLYANEQIEVICDRNCLGAYDITSNYNFMEKTTNKIASEYLEKALPPYMRIVMPSLKKKDFDKERTLLMRVGEEETLVTIKKAMFLLAEKKTKMRYDINGKKRHFIEADTLRNLNNRFLMFSSMEDIYIDGKIDLFKFDSNHRKFMDDLLFHYLYEELPKRERKFFVRLSEESIQRRGSIIVKDLLQKLNKEATSNVLKLENGELRHQFQEECRIYGYSYGELMRSFYFMGRESIYDKKLVHALLSMYTAVMTKIFYRYKVSLEFATEEYKDICHRNFKMLRELMAGSVGGSWSAYLVPRVRRRNLLPNFTGSSFYGAIKEVNLKNLQLMIDSKTIKSINNLKKGNKKDMSLSLAQLICDMKNQIVILMFFSNFHNESLTGEYYGLNFLERIDIGDKATTDKRMLYEGDFISFKDVYADFNVLNFVNNCFDFEHLLDELMNEILVICRKDSYAVQIDKTNVLEETKRILRGESHSFYSKMMNWIENTGGMVLPVYSTDVYYNMLKRIAREARYSLLSIENDKLFIYLRKFFQNIAMKLRELDMYYEKTEVGTYYKTFMECPLVQEIFQLNENDNPQKDQKYQLAVIYNDFLGKVIDATSQGSDKLLEYDNMGGIVE